MPAGRPSTYTPELAETILLRMSAGESVRHICLDSDMPDKTTVNQWRIRREEFSRQYARARRAQVEARIEDASEIADEMPKCEFPDPDGVKSTRIDPAGVQRNKLRCEQARWEASKLLRGGLKDEPLDYGDKQVISGSDGGPVELIVKHIGSDGDYVTKQ